MPPDRPSVYTKQNLLTVQLMRVIHELGLQHQLAHVRFDDIALADVARRVIRAGVPVGEEA